MQTVIKIEDELNILDEHIKKMNASKVMLVCGSSIRFLKYDLYFRELQSRLGIDVVRFSDFSPNPTYDSAVKGVEMFNKERCDAIVAVGGGSSMDVAKCIKLFANMPKTVDNYLKYDIVPNDIPFVVVPTTAGTGSEATRFAVIYYEGEKVSVEHESCLPMLVVMDSDVLSNLPIYHKKAAVLDALCHAIESFWSVNSNDESKEYSRQAIRLILDNIDEYLGMPVMYSEKSRLNDVIDIKTVYENMQRAAYLAGKAINITKTTAGHAMCYKLTTLYGIAHGHAAALCVSKVLPFMIKHTDCCNDVRGERYLNEMFEELSEILGCDNLDNLACWFDRLLGGIKLDIPCAKEPDYIVLENSVNMKRLSNNPIKLDKSAIEELYHQILGQDNNIEKRKIDIQRKILLNAGPSTTTDTVKMAQVVPDICPREKEFQVVMASIREDLVKIVQGNLDEYTAVLFCGSGTIGIDIAINSLLAEGKKACIINNGAYSSRAVEVANYYGIPCIEIKQPIDQLPDLNAIENVLKANKDIGYVYVTHHETGTGLLNPIRDIGALAHKYGVMMITDTTSSYAMIPIDVYKDNIDFCMASAQKGIMGMTGLSFIIGRRSIIEESTNYPKRSYYCNLFMQYDYFEKTGEMHFTPPVQTVYAARQALNEYFEEGEMAKWERHKRVMQAIHDGEDEMGLKEALDRSVQSGLVSSVCYPADPNWNFDKVHDYCYERGFTIYPGKIDGRDTFRLCALGAIDEQDIKDFFVVFKEAFGEFDISYGKY